VLGAAQEWQAIQRLTEAGVPTMTAVAYGERGSNPARQHSFIVTEELAPTVDLEQLSLNWAQQPPKPALKWALIREVAQMTGAMHRAGVNHRDCYICHFLLHTDTPVTADNLRLSLIDLHRAQVRSATPRRWRDKDLAALYFSALHIGLTRPQFVPRDLLHQKAVVRFVPVETPDDVVPISPRLLVEDIRLIAARIRITHHIEPVPRPSLAIRRRRQQTVHDHRKGIRARVSGKGSDLLR
jgi:hypothetical protein